VADKCGGCQWQHIDYALQQETKRNHVIQSLERLGGFEQPPVAPMLPLAGFPDAANADLHYRNKATYPISRSATGQLQVGYYRKGSHQLVNLNQCPIQDERLDPLLAAVKQDIQQRGWSVYNETQHRGILRHLGLRIGRRTGEMLLTLVATQERIAGLAEQAAEWGDRHPQLVGVALNINSRRTNAIFGSETHLIHGRDYLLEDFAGLSFRVHPTTFFQVFTEQAEALLMAILEQLQLTGTEIVVDAYAGIGTLTLPIAQRVKRAIALEVQPEAADQARLNAQLNHLENVTVHTGTVEALLPTLDLVPDLVLLDPPRKGCDAAVLETLRQQCPARIVYVSCNPATLARDLKRLCEDGLYTLTHVQPADFFPQTTHVECAAFLTYNDSHDQPAP
jgi:23S rRNA (uracil1939-C5)-methyltransferase